MDDLYNDLLKSSTQDEFTTEKVNVISNCLLGNYDENGEYIIPNNIVKELIEVKKLKKSVFKNSVFCGAFVPGYGEMVFEVTFQKNTVKEIAMSELYLLENEYKVNGYIQNTIRTKIASFTDQLDGFIENTYDHFNISISADERSVKEFKITDEVYTLEYINAKRNFNMNMSKLTKKEYNKLYKDYVTKKLELLKSLNTPYALAVLEKFNQEYAKIEKYFLQDNNYKAVSELLDKCIEDMQNVNPLFAKQEQEFINKSKPLIDEFSKKAGEIAEKAHPKAMGDLSKDDRVRNEELERELYENKKAKASEKRPAKQAEVSQSAPTSDKRQKLFDSIKKVTDKSSNSTPRTPEPTTTKNVSTFRKEADIVTGEELTSKEKTEVINTEMMNPEHTSEASYKETIRVERGVDPFGKTTVVTEKDKANAGKTRDEEMVHSAPRNVASRDEDLKSVHSMSEGRGRVF